MAVGLLGVDTCPSEELDRRSVPVRIRDGIGGKIDDNDVAELLDCLERFRCQAVPLRYHEHSVWRGLVLDGFRPSGAAPGPQDALVHQVDGKARVLQRARHGVRPLRLPHLIAGRPTCPPDRLTRYDGDWTGGSRELVVLASEKRAAGVDEIDAFTHVRLVIRSVDEGMSSPEEPGAARCDRQRALLEKAPARNTGRDQMHDVVGGFLLGGEAHCHDPGLADRIAVAQIRGEIADPVRSAARVDVPRGRRVGVSERVVAAVQRLRHDAVHCVGHHHLVVVAPCELESHPFVPARLLRRNRSNIAAGAAEGLAAVLAVAGGKASVIAVDPEPVRLVALGQLGQKG